MEITATVNGKTYQHDIPARLLLVHYLRERLNLTGAHVGCDTSQCGACVVHLNGESVKSCTLFAVQADGAQITTIEGLAQNGEYSAMQQGFWEMHGLQCGFCTPGMIMSATDLLQRNPNPSDHEIRYALEGNLCRCTGYENIVRAVQYAAGQRDSMPMTAGNDGGAISTPVGEEELSASGDMHAEAKPLTPETPAEIDHPQREAVSDPINMETVEDWKEDNAGADEQQPQQG